MTTKSSRNISTRKITNIQKEIEKIKIKKGKHVAPTNYK